MGQKLIQCKGEGLHGSVNHRNLYGACSNYNLRRAAMHSSRQSEHNRYTDESSRRVTPVLRTQFYWFAIAAPAPADAPRVLEIIAESDTHGARS